MRKFTSLLMLCFMALGLTANAQTLDLTNSSNVYTVDSEKRGYLYYDEAKSTTYILSTWLNSTTENLSHPKADGSVANNQFAFIQSTTSGKVYMYSVAAKKFLKQSNTNIVLTEDPEASVTLTANGTFYLIAFESGDEINLTNWDGNQQGIRVAGADPDGGNKMTITKVSTSDELSAAIEKVNPAVTPDPDPVVAEPINDIAQLSNFKAYTATLPNHSAHSTGWAVNTTDLKSIVYDLKLTQNNDDPNQQFAFLTPDEGATYYLYSVGQSKYISNTGKLTESPTHPIVFKNGNRAGTFVVWFDKNHIANVGGSGQMTIDGWGPGGTQGFADDGNSIVITPVDDFDPADALSKFVSLEAITATQFVANQVYLIKNVSNSRSGFLYVGNDNALCIGELDDMNNAPNNYLFKAMPTNSGLVLKAVEGGYVPTGDGAGTNLSATTVSKAAVVTVAAKGGTFPETTLNMLVNGNYCNVNPGAFCTWNDKNDANGVWEFYAIEEIANVEAAQMTTVTGLAEQALALDGVGYPVASERENLNNTVAAAKAFNTSGAWYEEMVNTLTAYASTTNVKMPEDGKAYTFTNVQKNGTKYYWHYDASGVTMSSNASDATVYVCKVLDNGKYAFVNNEGKFMIFKGTEGNRSDNGQNDNKGYIDAYDATYADLTIAKLAGGSVAPANQADILGFVSISGHREEGNNTNGCHVIKANGSFDMATAAFFNDNFSSAFLITEVEFPNKPVVNDANGVEDVAAISTFCAPFATVAPNNVDVYIAASDESHYIKLQKVEGAVPANTGVVLVSTDDALVGQAVTMVPATTEALADVTGNLLRGDAAKADYTVDAAVNAYVLGAVDGVAGFYPLSATDRTIKQGKAYLELDASLSAVKLYFGGDEATGIETVVKENANAPIFDLSGRRVVNVAKGGIYIQNGKKFIVK